MITNHLRNVFGFPYSFQPITVAVAIWQIYVQYLKEFDPPLKCLECLASLSNYPLTPILSQLKGSNLNCSSCLIELHCNLRRREGMGTMQTIRTHQDHQGILGS